MTEQHEPYLPETTEEAIARLALIALLHPDPSVQVIAHIVRAQLSATRNMAQAAQQHMQEGRESS